MPVDWEHTQKFAFAKPQPPEEQWAVRWVRRTVLYLGYVLMLAFLVVVLPVALPILAVVDLLKQTDFFMVRAALFTFVYVVYELLGVIIACTINVFSGYWLSKRLYHRHLRMHFWLQQWWVGTIMRIGFKIFSVRLEIENKETLGGRRPFILFLRHASMLDTIIPPYIFYPMGIHLRIVLKRELLWDPSLDISFQNMINAFVRRGSGQGQKEIEKVSRLMEGLGAYEGVMIYPEGTRFTTAKKQRILEKIAETGDVVALERAKSFQRILPPRPGGPMALLERNDCADAIFCAHAGLERAATFHDLRHGGIIGKTVYMKFWRVPFEQIPTNYNGRLEWLYTEWKKIDDFVVQHAEPGEPLDAQ